MAEQQTTPDHVLYQLVESVFVPVSRWAEATHVFTREQMVSQLTDFFPGRFTDVNQIYRILNELHFKTSFNEHNNKNYYLVKMIGGQGADPY